MRFTTKEFSPAEKITIAASSWKEFGQLYGKATKETTHKQWNTLSSQLTQENRELLQNLPKFESSLIAMSESSAFAVYGINRFFVYRELLLGFAEGAELSFSDALALQIIDNIACQTLLIQDKATENMAILHMEENFVEPEFKRDTYDFRVVDATVGRHHIAFFGYPGLCFGGPAMGINYTTDAFVAVDTVLTSPQLGEGHTIWGNAIASIALLLGTKRDLVELSNILDSNGITFTDGYAVHLAERSKRHIELLSLEFGGKKSLILPPYETETRRFIAQPNIVRSEVVAAWDSLHEKPDAPLSLEMQRRQKRLSQWAETMPLPFGSMEQLTNALSSVCYYSPGDRYEDNGPSETGLNSSSVVSYAFGRMMPDSSEVVFGKGIPSTPAETPVSLEVKKQATSILPPTTIHYPKE